MNIGVMRADYVEISVSAIKYILVFMLFRRAFRQNLPPTWVNLAWGLLVVRLFVPYAIRFYPEDIPLYFQNIPSGIVPIVKSMQSTGLYLATEVDLVMPRLYRLLSVILVASYVFVQYFRYADQIHQSGKRSSEYPHLSDTLKNWIHDKNANERRKIEVYINDKIAFPMTMGVLHPKIIIPEILLYDDNVDLTLILEHEYTHILRYHPLYKHIINLVLCIHFFNPVVWLLCRKIHQDIEVSCDYETIRRVGEAVCVDYLKTLLYLYSNKHCQSSVKAYRFALQMNPTKERMLFMKNKYKINFAVCITYILLIAFTSTSFALPRPYPNIQVVEFISEAPGPLPEPNPNIRELSLDAFESEYGMDTPRSINVNETITIKPGTSKIYTFTMTSWLGSAHNKIGVSVSNITSSGNIRYNLLLSQDENELFNSTYTTDGSFELTNVPPNGTYTLMIMNTSAASMKCTVKVKSAGE